MFVLGYGTSLIPLSDPARKLYFGSVLVVVSVLAGFLNRESTFWVKIVSTLMIVLAWFALGFLESWQTGFVPPYVLIAASAGLMIVIASVAVFVVSALFRVIIGRRVPDQGRDK